MNSYEGPSETSSALAQGEVMASTLAVDGSNQLRAGLATANLKTDASQDSIQARFDRALAEIRVLERHIMMKKAMAQERTYSLDIVNALRLVADSEKILRFVRVLKLHLANQMAEYFPRIDLELEGQGSSGSLETKGTSCLRKRKRAPSSVNDRVKETASSGLIGKKKVKFSDSPHICGTADDYNRSARIPSQPTLLEDIILRIFGTYPENVPEVIRGQLYITEDNGGDMTEQDAETDGGDGQASD